jgi:GNAT superfamily N-acetyltransferase
MRDASRTAAPRPPRVLIRSMTYEDVAQVVDMHLRLFHDTPALLGPRFLREFYRHNLHEIALVATLGRRVVGYHLTFTDERESTSALLRRDGLRLALAGISSLLRHPRLLVRLPASLRRRMTSPDSGKALSLYTAVASEAQGRGIAKDLLRRMVTDAAARGIVAIEGEQEDDPRLWRLYESVGFRPTGEVRVSGGRKEIPVILVVKEAMERLAAGPTEAPASAS